MSEITNIPHRTIVAYLDDEFKREYESTVPSDFGIGERVRIPEPVAASVKQAVSSLQQLVKEEPRIEETTTNSQSTYKKQSQKIRYPLLNA